MWILWLEWVMLAMLVFWCLGALKRLKRLRTSCKNAFAGVDTQFLQVIELMRSCARMQALKEQVVTIYTQHAQNSLLPSADLLEAAVQQARQHPLRRETIAALDSAWQGAQVAWQAYAQLSAEHSPVHAEHVQAWSQRWSQLYTLQVHSTAQFNAAVQDYNLAIAQFPACAIATVVGHRSGRTFQKDAARMVQSIA